MLNFSNLYVGDYSPTCDFLQGITPNTLIIATHQGEVNSIKADAKARQVVLPRLYWLLQNPKRGHIDQITHQVREITRGSIIRKALFSPLWQLTYRENLLRRGEFSFAKVTSETGLLCEVAPT